MNLGQKIVKTLIVFLEGCVVKLKEIESRWEIQKEDIFPQDDSHKNTNTHQSDKITKDAEYYNISLLDQYEQELGLPIGTSFMKLIQRVERMTEFNMVESLLSAVDNEELLYSFIDGLREGKNAQFAVVKPSTIRDEEMTVVDKSFICSELEELQLSYDDDISLFDNSIRVIESRQLNVLSAIYNRYLSFVSKIKESESPERKRTTTELLRKELLNHKQVISTKLSR